MPAAGSGNFLAPFPVVEKDAVTSLVGHTWLQLYVTCPGLLGILLIHWEKLGDKT